MPGQSKPSDAEAQAEFDAGRLAEWVDQTAGADIDVRIVQLMLGSAFRQLGCPAVISVAEMQLAWEKYYRFLTPTPQFFFSREHIRRCIAELKRRGVLSVEGGLSLQTFAMRWRGMH